MNNLPWHLLRVDGQHLFTVGPQKARERRNGKDNKHLHENLQVFLDALEDERGMEFVEWAKPRLKIWRKRYAEKFHPSVALSWTDSAAELDEFIMSFKHGEPEQKFLGFDMWRRKYVDKSNHLHMMELLACRDGTVLTAALKFEFNDDTIIVTSRSNNNNCRLFSVASYNALLFGHKPPPA